MTTEDVKRDRYGRYILLDPITGEERTWTRATTVANTLADRYGLEQWAKRNVILGLAARHDLYAQAASCTPDDKTELNRIVEIWADTALRLREKDLRLMERLVAAQSKLSLTISRN